MKKKIAILTVVLTVIICFIIIIFIFSYNKKNDVVLVNYSTVESENKMTLIISVADSIGYARDLSVKDNGKDKYITFYSTYPLLSRYGKSEYEIDLDQDCENIYFNRGNRNFGSTFKNYKGERYSLVLKKDKETNEWSIIE